jgi:pyruvate-formate lyase-activating enzyme
MVPGMLDVKGTQILAKSLFKELRGSGYTPNQILSLSTELIDLVTKDLKNGHEESHVAGAQTAPKEGWRAAI